MKDNSEDRENAWREELQQYYQVHDENNRLRRGEGQLEFVRTQRIIQRYLPSPPSKILDVGGGSGVYALWLARLGHEVHLIDFVPRHVEQAKAASDSQPEAPLASIQVGDARELDFQDSAFDGLLMLGPLYHLPVREDRIQALREAHRVLKPGGVLLAAGISRFASTLDGLRTGALKDPGFWEIVQQDLTDGQHHNPTRETGYFTETFFHHPDELVQEVSEAGFQLEDVLGIEGPGWLTPEFDTWWDKEEYRSRLLTIAERLETEPTMLGIGAHLMAVGRKS
jgi:ubiquinone/menaquinone biosynthesis C-methylase UbiE